MAFSEEIPDELSSLVRFMETGIPFNKFLGMKVIALVPGRCVLTIPAADHLVGDPFRPAIHGGVISTIADVAGGAACFSMMKSAADRISTVDMRVDYLLPGLADRAIECEARVLRMGNKVAVTRMEVYSAGDCERPIALGHGVYNVLRRSGRSPAG